VDFENQTSRFPKKVDTVCRVWKKQTMSPEQKPKAAQGPAVYTEEFKRSVVDHWCHSDKTAEEVAKDFGVKAWNVRDWRRRYGPTHKPVDAPLPQTPEELRREVQQLRKELARVTTQRDILKKTMGILSEP
jgi:transposase